VSVAGTYSNLHRLSISKSAVLKNGEESRAISLLPSHRQYVLINFKTAGWCKTLHGATHGTRNKIQKVFQCVSFDKR
jgi:hypothetical protein